MERIRQLSTLLLAMVIWPCTALAQDELIDEEQVPVKYYTVELIVFTYEENVGVGTEVFPPEAPGAETDDIGEISVADKGRRHPDAVGLRPDIHAKDDFTMSDVARRLQLLDAYAPVMHVAWTQAGFPQADTDPLQLSAFGAVPQGLSGSFTLYLARYLHLVVDLTMDGAPAEIAVQFDDEPAYSLSDIAGPVGPVRYRIQEDRIVKNGEIRYYDHPKFGVVAKVTRLKEQQDESATNLLTR